MPSVVRANEDVSREAYKADIYDANEEESVIQDYKMGTMGILQLMAQQGMILVSYDTDSFPETHFD